MKKKYSKTEELTGIFANENYVFQDGTPQRFVIARMKDGTIIKGEAMPDDLKPGVLYRFDGTWKTHPKYGKQFQFISFCQPAPVNRESIEGYLATCPGIGPMRASRIFDLYGVDALQVIKSNPQKLATDIKGVTSEIALQVQISLLEREAKEGFVLEMKALLGGKGYPKKIYKLLELNYGTSAPESIRNNPYILLAYKGVGFERADRLYLELGKDQTAIIRQTYFLRWLLDCDRSGSVWVENRLLQGQFSKEFGELAKFHEAIEEGLSLKLFVQKNNCIADPYSANCEHYIARWLADACREREALWPKELVQDESVPSDHQQSQYLRAISGSISILAGSPGTGKTWLVGRMIKTLQQSGKRIAVCAPTGKAALRVVESLAAQGVAETASTIHSLLQAEIVDGGWRFRYNEDNKLPFDFIIIDESSMIDVSLLSSLLKAVDIHTNVMFVGDPDQLAPVGKGAPLRDMIDSLIPSGQLTEIRRNAGAIVHACASVRENNRFDVHVNDIKSLSYYQKHVNNFPNVMRAKLKCNIAK